LEVLNSSVKKSALVSSKKSLPFDLLLIFFMTTLDNKEGWGQKNRPASVVSHSVPTYGGRFGKAAGCNARFYF
jgi:hypothetical protein